MKEMERKDSNWIKAVVVSTKGNCDAGHKVGDTAIFKDMEIEGRICLDAFCSMAAKVYGQRYNADLPWLPAPDAPVLHACPNPENTVVFELTRVPKT